MSHKPGVEMCVETDTFFCRLFGSTHLSPISRCRQPLTVFTERRKTEKESRFVAILLYMAVLKLGVGVRIFQIK
jgi:hypothetical protein